MSCFSESYIPENRNNKRLRALEVYYPSSDCCSTGVKYLVPCTCRSASMNCRSIFFKSLTYWFILYLSDGKISWDSRLLLSPFNNFLVFIFLFLRELENGHCMGDHCTIPPLIKYVILFIGHCHQCHGALLWECSMTWIRYLLLYMLVQYGEK